jgi:type III secretion system YscQ/HrcQ family protein
MSGSQQVHTGLAAGELSHRMSAWTDARSVTLEDLAAADHPEVTNLLYGVAGLRAGDFIWYWQLGTPTQIEEWVTLAADDIRIEIALDGDATGLSPRQLDWRMYTGETRLLAWTACHESLIELLRAVFQRDWVPESIGDCDPPSRDACMRAGFNVSRTDGTPVVSGVANFDTSWVRTFAMRSGLAEPRPDPLLTGVRARLHIVIDAVEADSAELDSLSAGAIVRLDNRTLASHSARVVIPAGSVRLIADVTGAHARVVGFTDGGDTMITDHTPKDVATSGAQAHAVQIGALPVRLTFLAGRLTLPFGDLSTVGPGYVFPLDKPLDDQAITVCANDVPVAVGELVTIGDLVGVRITRMLPRV